MAPADLNTFLQGLENQWQTLLRDRDTAGGVFPRTYCAYETQPTAGFIVVGRVYAATRCDTTPYPLDLDHSAIVKPASREAEPYPWVKKRLLESAALLTDRIPGQFSVVVGWGRAGDKCGMTLDGSRLAAFADTQEVALICGPVDQGKDMFKDTNITISRTWTIHEGAFDIEVAHSATMRDAIKEMARQRYMEEHGTEPPKGVPIPIFFQTWYRVLLVPKGTDVSQIHSLSDVPKQGGVLLPAER